MITDDEALEQLGKGMTLNAFSYLFEHEAGVLLSRLQIRRKVIVEFSKKHKLTVVLLTESSK